MQLKDIIGAARLVGASGLALVMLASLNGCDKKRAERDLPLLDWSVYVGHYPLSGPQHGMGVHPTRDSLPLAPLIATEQLQAAIGRTLNSAERAEFTGMAVESPIESPAPGYLISHVCQAHNCPHGVDIIYDANARKLAMVFYRSDANPDANQAAIEHAARITCYSEDFDDLGELPAAVQTATRAHLISQASGTFTLKDLACKN